MSTPDLIFTEESSIFRAPKLIPMGKNDVQKIILYNDQSPGDIIMLTAAVRDLHRSYPGRFLTDVRSRCPDLWLYNPFITKLEDSADDVRVIPCKYPLINRANQWPYHFIHGFIHFLNKELKLAIRPSAFKGDIHMSAFECSQNSYIHDLTSLDMPFWVVAAGGKWDYTVKWWSTERYQSVIDAFRGRIVFVQIGHQNHHHPPLRGVINLTGKTTLRQLVHLIHHAQGVLCPITGAMHMAPAIPTRGDRPGLRACVVIAGGREPPHWESYPNHQFVHRVGMLTCCETGGCWKARTIPLGDGDKKDSEEWLCRQVTDGLPRCMSMITPEEIIARINGYFEGGALNYLTSSEVKAIGDIVGW